MADGTLGRDLENVFTEEENTWFTEGDTLDYALFRYDGKGWTKQIEKAEPESRVEQNPPQKFKKEYGIKISFELGLNPLRIKVYRDAYS